MTQNTSKNTQTWTIKHEQFAIKNRINKVLQTFWRWLFTLPVYNDKYIEFQFKDFQKYIKKLRGKPHDAAYVKQEWKKLIGLRIIDVDKCFDDVQNAYRIKLRHPSAVTPKKRSQNFSPATAYFPQKEGSNDCNLSAGFNSSNISNPLENADNHTDNVSCNNLDKEDEQSELIAQQEKRQQLYKIQLCAKYGIYFDASKRQTKSLYKHEYLEVQLALNHFEQAKKSTNISNPQGWLVRCLNEKWYEDFNLTYEQFDAITKKEFFDVLKQTSVNVV